MCGIAGILNINREPVAYTQIKQMTEAISHRGPDGEGCYVDGALGLGHRRLAIIDLSPAGHQPMQTKTGNYIITYNGEVYNFQELRIELEALGYQFHSKTDTEVVLNAYAAWGPKCIETFNGMFAFAIWDKKKKKLFLARDRYGIKPIYYYQDSKHFVFASEVKAIIASNLYQAAIDKEGLVEYLTFQNYFTDKTLYKNIKILKAGHFFEIDMSGQAFQKQYWDFEFQDTLSLTEGEAIEEVDRLFKQAVQRQLISDVPVNSYLSGGVDSGSITMVASKYVNHMRTFTIGFDLNSASGLELAFDERNRAEYISYLAKTEHYEMVLKAGDMERCMDKVIWHLEEPRVGQSYPNYYAAKLASKFGKVVLAGTGGDELFAGYPWRYFYSEKPCSFDKFIDQYYLKWQRLMPNSVLKKLVEPISDEINHVWTKDTFRDVFHRIKKPELNTFSEFINYSLYLESKTFLHGLLVVEDKLSMAHGLETRVPFLDNDLVDFAMKLPAAQKLNISGLRFSKADENEPDQKREMKTLTGKRLLRKALARYLPEDFLNAKKQGFSAPDASWFKGESIEYVKKELQSSISFLSEKILKDILREHIKGRKNNRLLIWSMLYLKKFVEMNNLETASKSEAALPSTERDCI